MTASPRQVPTPAEIRRAQRRHELRAALPLAGAVGTLLSLLGWLASDAWADRDRRIAGLEAARSTDSACLARVDERTQTMAADLAAIKAALRLKGPTE